MPLSFRIILSSCVVAIPREMEKETIKWQTRPGNIEKNIEDFKNEAPEEFDEANFASRSIDVDQIDKTAVLKALNKAREVLEHIPSIIVRKYPSLFELTQDVVKRTDKVYTEVMAYEKKNDVAVNCEAKEIDDLDDDDEHRLPEELLMDKARVVSDNWSSVQTAVGLVGADDLKTLAPNFWKWIKKARKQAETVFDGIKKIAKSERDRRCGKTVNHSDEL